MAETAALKRALLDAAEVVDAWRLFPRLFLLGYGLMCWHVVAWAMALPVLSVEQAGLAGGVTAMFAPLSNWYMQTGRRWGAAQ